MVTEKGGVAILSECNAVLAVISSAWSGAGREPGDKAVFPERSIYSRDAEEWLFMKGS